MSKKILLIGGDNKAKSIARKLSEKNYDITVVNKDLETCKYLAQIKKIKVIHGDGTDPYILNDACANEMDIAIALTPTDEDNFVVCQLCKKKFNVRKTICLLIDANKKEFFYKSGIDVVVSPISLITSIIEQETFMDEILKIIPVDNGRLKITEISISKDSYAINKKIRDINFEKDMIISCILRGSKIIIPNGDTSIFYGDILVILSSNDIKDFNELIRR